MFRHPLGVINHDATTRRQFANRCGSAGLICEQLHSRNEPVQRTGKAHMRLSLAPTASASIFTTINVRPPEAGRDTLADRGFGCGGPRRHEPRRTTSDHTGIPSVLRQLHWLCSISGTAVGNNLLNPAAKPAELIQ